MPRPITATIDLSALEHNLGVAKRIAPRSRVMAVVKANAYGHGLVRVAQALSSADGFAVLELDAAIRLRNAGHKQTILLLEGFFSVEELPLIEQHCLAIVVHCAEQIRTLTSYAGGRRFEVFLKINTGMNRLGLKPEEIPAALDALKSNRAILGVVLMTHFASADGDEGIAEPLRVFNEAAAGLRLPRSLANSPALLRYPETHADWVRPGLMLYGASPLPKVSAEELGLRPAMTLSSAIVAIQRLQAGERVGYRGRFTAEMPMTVGIVASGYADGYPRGAPTGTPVLVDGVRTRTLGLVAMDMLCVDLTPIAKPRIGTPVTLWGDGLPVEEVAKSAGRVSYELLCALPPRVRVVEK
ncbi:MAG: alanine racemase [Burkholderiales bacterium]